MCSCSCFFVRGISWRKEYGSMGEGWSATGVGSLSLFCAEFVCCVLVTMNWLYGYGIFLVVGIA